MAPAGMAGIINDALALYFAEPAFAHAFVARFCCGYRVETMEGALAIRSDPRPAAPLPCTRPLDDSASSKVWAAISASPFQFVRAHHPILDAIANLSPSRGGSC